MRARFAVALSTVAVLTCVAADVSADENQNRARATLERMKSIGTAIEAYMTDVNTPPDVASVDALVPLLTPIYIKNLPLRDGWDTPFRYVRAGEHAFRIVSAGADRRFDEKSWTVAAQSKDLAADAVFGVAKADEAGVFQRVWTDASGAPLAETYEEAREALQPAIDAEMEKMKGMSEEQSWSYFRTSSTIGSMSALTFALEAYKAKRGSYPVAKTMAELEQALFPEFTADVIETDAWGTELRYVAAKNGRSYKLISAGADRKFDAPSWTKRGTLATADEDAVVENGEFVRTWDETTRPGAR